MNKRIMQMEAVVVLAMLGIGVASAAESPSPQPTATMKTELDKLVGQPVNIVPWAYVWRADLAVQEKPEAYFIPRRLERLDKVYRTAFHALPQNELASPAHSLGLLRHELLNPLLPSPKGRLQAGLLWTGRVAGCQVELHWPDSMKEVPSPEAVEVRTYPTGFGWFGWTVDEVLDKPKVSADQHTWTYNVGNAKSLSYARIDDKWVYEAGSATEMIAVFYEGAESTPMVPDIRVIVPSLGQWKRMDVEIEWGFQPEAKESNFDGHVETYVAKAGPVEPLAEDKGTKVTDGNSWQSRSVGDCRRGIVMPLLYVPDQPVPDNRIDIPSGQAALDSRVTIWTKTNGFTFRICDLEKGPILIPEHGIFVTKAGSGQTARQFTKELAAKNLKSIRQLTREHREAASWEEVMREVRLSKCPAGTTLSPFPQVPDSPVEVQVPDAGWTATWRAATQQLRGRHLWGGLAFEVGRVAHEMDMVGLHEEADKVYQYFLKAPGAKSDGDFIDGKGSLEYAIALKHDMGYSQDGTHAATGRVLFAMADRYFLTGDKEWFERHRARMAAAADWIIRQRKSYLEDIPNRQELLVAGLMPPCMLGDYALPSCEWHWFYCDNAFSLQGLQRFADALIDFDPEANKKYQQEAKAFRKAIRRAIEQEAALSPVRLGRDGMYHSFIPGTAYNRGKCLTMERGSLQRPQMDILIGALPLAEPFSAVDANDARIADTLTVMEDIAISPEVTPHVVVNDAMGKRLNLREDIETSVSTGQKLDDAWFWNCYGASFPKCSHNANIYLLQDDVPSFLRFWMNSYAGMPGPDGVMWEVGHLDSYTNCVEPDNGTAGWFLENFRNLLMMEDGQSLWLARATPRVWLEQGKKIVVKNAPTYFGTLAYEIVSDVDNGKITARVEIPSRDPPESVIVRLRHPKVAPIRSVTVNGNPWTRFNTGKEVIEVMGVTGKVAVVASY